MQFVFTYIRKPVRLTWVWRIFALTGRHMSTQPRDGEWFRAGQSKLPDRTSHSADPRQAAWRTYRFASSRSQLRNKNPVLGKMGKPVGLTDLSLYAAAQGHASLVSPRKWRQRIRFREASVRKKCCLRPEASVRWARENEEAGSVAGRRKACVKAQIKPVNPKGNQPWMFIRRTDAEMINDKSAMCPLVWKH